MRAIAGEPFRARIEVEDPIGAVARLKVALRAQLGGRGSDATWHEVMAEPADGGWWVATFPPELVPDAPAAVQLRAEILAKRGGLLLSLGHDEPFEVEVMSAERARVEDRAKARIADQLGDKGAPASIGSVRSDGAAIDAGPAIAAVVGVEARAGTAARARAIVGAGAALGDRTELFLGVAVGPAFARPAALAGGGPLVLGVDLALRVSTSIPGRAPWTPFVEMGGNVDLRLPGVDPGLALRLGVARRLGESTALEGALGGSLVLFRAAGEDAVDGAPELPGASGATLRPPGFGFAGGLRIAVRFGGAR